MAVSFKGTHFPQDSILMGVRWYVAYPLSYRHVEELMAERGVSIDHATIQRWVVKYSAQLAEAFHRRTRPVGRSWRMDETYLRVKGAWRYLYRAVDKSGQTHRCPLKPSSSVIAILPRLTLELSHGLLPFQRGIGSTSQEGTERRARP